MQPKDMIALLKREGDLNAWLEVIREEGGNQEMVESRWYNILLEEMDHCGSYIPSIAREMWELGMQAFDWSSFYDLMVKELTHFDRPLAQAN